MRGCSLLNHAQLFATPWIVTHQAPLSMGFPRWEYSSGLPFPSPGIESRSSCMADRLFTIFVTREAHMRIFFFFFGQIMWLVGFLVPWLGIELGPSAVKVQVLTTGLPGNSQEAFFFHWISIFHVAYYRILNLVPNIIDTEYSSLLYSRPLLFIYPINTSLHLRVPYYQSILGNHKPVLCLWVYFCFVDRFICAIF